MIFPKLQSVFDEIRAVAQIDVDIIEVARRTIKHLNGSQDHREVSQAQQALELRWYESLKRGEPDYTVYADRLYNAELFACFWTYSRKYLMEIAKKGLLKDAKVIVDVGCGLGLTTALIKNIAPNARVYGTNIPDTEQYRIASKLGEKYDFEIVDKIKYNLNKPDVVFASEYFEHFEKPIQHLEEILMYKPGAMLIANTFTSKSIGHFDEYVVNCSFSGKPIKYNGTVTSKLFNAKMRSAGYEKMHVGFWNQRPTFWERRDTSCQSLFS